MAQGENQDWKQQPTRPGLSVCREHPPLPPPPTTYHVFIDAKQRVYRCKTTKEKKTRWGRGWLAGLLSVLSFLSLLLTDAVAADALTTRRARGYPLIAPPARNRVGIGLNAQEPRRTEEQSSPNNKKSGQEKK